MMTERRTIFTCPIGSIIEITETDRFGYTLKHYEKELSHAWKAFNAFEIRPIEQWSMTRPYLEDLV